MDLILEYLGIIENLTEAMYYSNTQFERNVLYKDIQILYEYIQKLYEEQENGRS